MKTVSDILIHYRGEKEMKKEEIQQLIQALKECRCEPEYDYAAVIAEDQVFVHDPNGRTHE